MESLPNWLSTILIMLQVMLIAFWLFTAMSVPMAPMHLFEDHKHKHLWFYSVVFVPVIGAVWFFFWRLQKHGKYAEEVWSARIQGIADAYKKESA